MPERTLAADAGDVGNIVTDVEGCEGIGRGWFAHPVAFTEGVWGEGGAMF